MADVTINDLNRTTPTGNLLLPVSNGNVTYSAPLSDIQVDYGSIANKPSFATVATTGSYNDLSNKPTIPTNTGIGGAILFTSSATWTVPAGVTKIKVYCIGAGGRAGNGNRGSSGGSSYITGIDIVGGGGGAALSSGALGAGGVGSGVLCVSTHTGNAGSGAPGIGGTQSSQVFGTTAGNGASCNNGGGGGAGGYAFGVATVTPGSTLSIVVGAIGSYSDCNNVSPLAGLVGIEW
jgi:hypothetical protein